MAQGGVKRRSIYDRTGQVWWSGKLLVLVIETTMSNDRRRMLHRCFKLEEGGFILLSEAKVKRWEWTPAWQERVT